MLAFGLIAILIQLAVLGVVVLVGYGVFRLIYAIYTKIREDGKWQ